MKTLQPKNILKLLKNRQVSLGFTLSELLFATSLSAVVISISGWGLMAMVHNQKISTEKDDILYNINRASEFISNEIRNAHSIEDQDSMSLTSQAPDFTLPTGAIPVLALKVPGVSQRIIYYTEKAPSPWLGPNVISRWGPSFNGKGEYDSPLKTPDKWQSAVLIDLVDDNNKDLGDASKLFTLLKPTCDSDSGWTPSIPTKYQPVHGFYACIGAKLPSGGGRLAQFNIGVNLDPKDPKNAKIISPTAQHPIAYEAKTTAFARVEVASSSGGLPGGLPCDLKNGSLICTKPGTLSIKVIGGSISCKGDLNPTIDVTTKMIINEKEETLGKESNISVDEGTTVDIRSIATAPISNGCVANLQNVITSDTSKNPQQFQALKDGDSIPDFNLYDNQTPIKDYLREYTDPITKKIKIDKNQIIYLFELGTSISSSPAYDMQDNVVLATIK